MTSRARAAARTIALVVAGLHLVAGTTLAGATFDPEEARGFVDRNDVRLALGWTNHRLDRNAHLVQFRVAANIQNTWSCYGPESTESFSNSVQLKGSLRSAAIRAGNRLTGFSIEGYSASPTSTRLDGPAFGCPEGWEYADNLTQTPTGFTYEVSTDGSSWYVVGRRAREIRGVCTSGGATESFKTAAFCRRFG